MGERVESERVGDEITVSVRSSGDTEIDAIAMVVAAMHGVRDVEARNRIANYIMSRYGARVVDPYKVDDDRPQAVGGLYPEPPNAP